MEISFGFETAFESKMCRAPFISYAALSQSPIWPILSNSSVEDRSEKVYSLLLFMFPL